MSDQVPDPRKHQTGPPDRRHPPNPWNLPRRPKPQRPQPPPTTPTPPTSPGDPAASADSGSDDRASTAASTPFGHLNAAADDRPSAAASTSFGHVNPDIDLDEVDPKRRARWHADVPKRAPWRVALLVVALTAVAVAFAVTGTGIYAVQHLLGQVHTINLEPLLKHRPPAAVPDAEGRTPLNVLVLGSQTRDGQHGVNLGNASKKGTDLSDTAFLVHLSADRRWAEVVSIPRDLEVTRPDCPSRLDPSRLVPGSDQDMFDAAMNYGGPACAVATVEQMTDIRVDHFVELTFNAFEALTNAVGGVPVCIPPPGINDPDYSGLVLKAGIHTIRGDQALEFIRNRHGLSTGMDTQRIQMQQMFMTSLFDQVTADGTLSDPVTLYKIANAVTANITVDTGLDNFATMASIAQSVGGIDKKYMQYITAPYQLDPADTNRLIPGDGFTAVWNYLRVDRPLPGSRAAKAFGTPAVVPARPTPTAVGTTDLAAPDSYTVPTIQERDDSAGAGPQPTPTPISSINTDSRNGDENLCAHLPTVADYGGSPNG